MSTNADVGDKEPGHIETSSAWDRSAKKRKTAMDRYLGKGCLLVKVELFSSTSISFIRDVTTRWFEAWLKLLSLDRQWGTLWDADLPELPSRT